MSILRLCLVLTLRTFVFVPLSYLCGHMPWFAHIPGAWCPVCSVFECCKRVDNYAWKLTEAFHQSCALTDDDLKQMPWTKPFFRQRMKYRWRTKEKA